MQLRISENSRNDRILAGPEKQRPAVPYFEDYDDKKMWMSYWHQINEVLKTGGRKILVVGVGNKTVSNYLKTLSKYLKHKKLKVTTADIDKNLHPEYVCDVSELTKCFKTGTFDTILCAEVLEHLPFDKFGRSLDELHKVTNQWVVLSLPYSGYDFRVSMELPGRSRKVNVTLKLPTRKNHKYDGWHYWEIGKKGYSRSKILGIIKRNFEVIREFLPPENMYHLFLVLKKKKRLIL